MNLPELIPMLSSNVVVWDSKQILPTAPVTIPVGGTHELFRYDKSGYAVAFGMTATSPLATLRLRYLSLGEKERLLQGSPASLQTGGLTSWNAGGWWSPPASNSMYFHPPTGMWVGWQKLCILEFVNPTALPIVVLQSTSVALLIQDMTAFIRIIRWLNGGEWEEKIEREKVPAAEFSPQALKPLEVIRKKPKPVGLRVGT